MIRTGGISGSRPDSAIPFTDQLVDVQILVLPISPFVTYPLVQTLRKRFRQPVGERLRHDRVVIVVIGAESGGQLIHAVTRRDYKRSEVIREARFLGGNE